MKTVKSDIVVPAVETQLSDNRIKRTYMYVYVDGFNAMREMRKHKTEHKKGWRRYDSDSVVYYGEKSHLWIYTEYWKKEKPTKRIKREE